METVWTDDEVDLLVEYAKQGLTNKLIAQKLGRTLQSVKSRREKYHTYQESKDTLCWTCSRAYANRCLWIATGREEEIIKMGGQYKKRTKRSTAATKNNYTVVRVDRCPRYVQETKRRNK